MNRGVTNIEYALIASLVAVMIFMIVRTVGADLSAAFSSAMGRIE